MTPVRRWEPMTMRLVQAVVGDFDDAFPGRRCLDRQAFCFRNPAFSASAAPWAAVSSAVVFYFGCVLGVEMSIRRRVRIRRLSVARRRGKSVAGGCEFAGRLLDRELG